MSNGASGLPATPPTASLVIDPNALLIKTDQQPATVAFFNNLITNICSAINQNGASITALNATSQNLVNLGLANINSTLGPFLSTLQQAAQLGFLVAEADGHSLSLSLGSPFDMILTSNGASLFTPTKWLMVMDVNDSTNWGVLQLVSWVQADLNLATTCIYASKTQASSSWQVTCGSGVLNAMVNDLNAANTAATNAANSASAAASAQAYVQSVQSSIAAGPVISVAGKTGAVLLQESDIGYLTSDLANRPTITQVNSQVAGLQPHAANLDQLSSAVLTAFGMAWITTANAAAAMSTLGAAPLSSPAFVGAPTAPTPTAGDNSTKLATTAFVAAASPTSIPSGIIQAQDADFAASTTLAASDNGKIKNYTGSAAATLTLPNNLPKDFYVTIHQAGTGQVTFTAASGAAVHNRQGLSHTAAQYALCSLIVTANGTGTAAVYTLGGDCA